MTHEELRGLSGGYALGVLDEPERRAFEQHLATCASCAAEIRDFTAVAPAREPRASRGERAGRASREPQRRPRRESLLALLSAAAVVIAVALGAYAISLQRRIGALEEQGGRGADPAAQSQQQLVQLRAAADRSTQVRRIPAADDLRRLDLAGTKGAPGASGRAAWAPRGGF